MPELPEVETVVRGLRGPLVGRRLVHVEARRPDLRTKLPDGFAERLIGRTVMAIERRAKYILMRLDDEAVLIAHLGMSGRFVVTEGQPNCTGPHEHVLLETDRGTVLRYVDPRRFGLMDLTSTAELASHPLLAGLGAEPLDAAFTGAVLAAQLAGRRTPIKSALLDQRIVAGIGNIYACEALYYARLSPRRLAASVQGGRAERLVTGLKEVLLKAIKAGGSSLRDHVQPSGELGYFQHEWAVYGREGAPCPACDCRQGVRRLTQAGRSTFYCAKRQR
jgi:formamidopyrimidine-DNA glycosylase